MLTPTPGRPNRKQRVRVIPVLLIDGSGRLVKSVSFGKRNYIGDPINAVKIFNTKEVDELLLIDIDATSQGRGPDYERIAEIAEEAFMPVTYGGGLQHIDQIERVYQAGIEKVMLSSVLHQGFDLISDASARWGSQAVTVCLPTGSSFLRPIGVRTHAGRKPLPGKPVDWARRAVEAGAGELVVYSIDRDGTWSGYDLVTLREVASAVGVPVIACGGASGVSDFALAIHEGKASAVAAGSFFVYQAKGKGVLISYPDAQQLAVALDALQVRK